MRKLLNDLHVGCGTSVRWAILLILGSLMIVISLVVYRISGGRITPTLLVELEVQNERVTWRGITPGHTLKRDVSSQLGRPRRIQSHQDIDLLFYGQGYPCEHKLEVCHRLAVQDGIVQTIVLSLYDKDPTTPNVTFEEIVAAFGLPTEVENNVLLYPHLGMAFVVYERILPQRAYREMTDGTFMQRSRELQPGDLDGHTLVEYVMLYAPVTLDQYHESWGRFHPLDNPWMAELPERVDQLEILPGKTNREEVVELLGEPDAQGFALRFFQFYMLYRTPGWPDNYLLRIFLDRRGVVQLVSGVVPAEPPYRMKEAIAVLGVPDWIESPVVENSPPRSNIHRVMWQDEGLIYRISKPPEGTDCSAPSRYPPTGWEPCPGLDDIVIAFERIIPPADDLSDIPHLPQSGWRP